MKLLISHGKVSNLDEGKVQGITSVKVNHDWKRVIVAMRPFFMNYKCLYNISSFLNSL